MADDLAVLVVEDEFLIAEEIRFVLEEDGLRVVGTAADAAEAWGLAEADPPEIALVDIRLAGGDDGVELARRLHQRFRTPCVFISGSHDPETRARAATVPSSTFLPKPFRTDLLPRLVREFAAAAQRTPAPAPASAAVPPQPPPSAL